MKADTKRPLAAVSLDLDNLWSYMRTHGEPGWENYPSYLDVFVPRVLEVLQQLNMKITFFIVGKDATIENNKEYLARLTAQGHEVANHSFLHEQWLHIYSRERIEQEIEEAEKAIAEVTGQKTMGFRGPGFCTNRFLFDVLTERGYLYESSSLPTFLGPLARAYYFRTAPLNRDERKKRKELFGSFKNGLNPTKPYLCQTQNRKLLLELPVTTVPFIKIPFHLSYLMYIARYSVELMQEYMNFAILLCKLSRTPINFLLHPLDLIGRDDSMSLSFFPAMDLDGERKREIFLGSLRILAKHYQLVNLGTFAIHILQKRNIKVVHNRQLF